ncbi:hypothetical protein NUSPORA_01665 [Nucleospora cyclopteri]
MKTIFMIILISSFVLKKEYLRKSGSCPVIVAVKTDKDSITFDIPMYNYRIDYIEFTNSLEGTTRRFIINHDFTHKAVKKLTNSIYRSILDYQIEKGINDLEINQNFYEEQQNELVSSIIEPINSIYKEASLFALEKPVFTQKDLKKRFIDFFNKPLVLNIEQFIIYIKKECTLKTVLFYVNFSKLVTTGEIDPLNSLTEVKLNKNETHIKPHRIYKTMISALFDLSISNRKCSHSLNKLSIENEPLKAEDKEKNMPFVTLNILPFVVFLSIILILIFLIQLYKLYKTKVRNHKIRYFRVNKV